MDAQSDSCEPPPCNPQPPGKIRKALKLFSKRKPGSGVASIFSVRVKGEGGFKSPPSRSKTLDELTEAVAAESVDLDQEDSHKEDATLDEPTRMKNNLESTLTRQSISSLTSAKSLSFLSMLRQNRKGGERETQTESHRSGQQRKGLKGLFGSLRWLRKDKEEEDEVLPGPPLLASRSNSVEIMKENLSLTPRPVHQSTDESEIKQQPAPSHDINVTLEDTNKVSGAAKPSTNDRLSTLLGDISSILSLDSLEGGDDIVADVEAEWVKVSSRVVVEAGTSEAVIKENALLALKPTLSTVSTFSTTSPTTPFPTAKFTSSTPLKLIPSPRTTLTLSPLYTPSPTNSTKPTPSHMSPHSLTSSSVPFPVLSTDSSPIPSSTVLVPNTIHKSLPTTPTLNIAIKPTLSTSPLTPEPSPKTSPTLFPSPVTVSKTLILHAETAPELTAAFAKITEPTHTQTPTIKHTINSAPTPIKPIHTITQDNKHSIAPVTKYPPFITSTKPVSTAPVIRPKIVTTFGLSTSRNTAPIVKPEPKQSAHQIKSGSFQYRTEKNGSGSSVPRTLPVDPPHVPKQLFANTNQPISTTLSVTFENPQHKPELVQTVLPSGPDLLPPTLLTRPAHCYVPREEKTQEIATSLEVAETPHIASSYKLEKNLVMKATILSKIPVSGGGKSKQHHKDVQSNIEERQRSFPTQVHEEESLISPSQEPSSNDGLSDLSTESGANTPVLSYSNKNIIDSSPLPTKGTVSMPRESKIPIKPGSTATYHGLKGKTDVTRSKIPVSKVPLRWTSNKNGSGSTADTTQK